MIEVMTYFSAMGVLSANHQCSPDSVAMVTYEVYGYHVRLVGPFQVLQFLPILQIKKHPGLYQQESSFLSYHKLYLQSV